MIYRNLIKINFAKRIIFDTCQLELDSEESIEATSDYIAITNSKLEQPKQKCLMGLVASSDRAKLVLSNITIKDPPKGALATKFLNVEFSNIKVDDSCICDIVHHLGCDEDNFVLNNDRYLSQDWKVSCCIAQCEPRLHHRKRLFFYCIAKKLKLGFVNKNCATGSTYNWLTNIAPE